MWTLYAYAFVLLLGLITYIFAKKNGMRAYSTETSAMISAGVWGAIVFFGFYLEGFLFGLVNMVALYCLISIQERIYDRFYDAIEEKEKQKETS